MLKPEHGLVVHTLDETSDSANSEKWKPGSELKAAKQTFALMAVVDVDA